MAIVDNEDESTNSSSKEVKEIAWKYEDLNVSV